MLFSDRCQISGSDPAIISPFPFSSWPWQRHTPICSDTVNPLPLQLFWPLQALLRAVTVDFGFFLGEGWGHAGGHKQGGGDQSKKVSFWPS